MTRRHISVIGCALVLLFSCGGASAQSTFAPISTPLSAAMEDPQHESHRQPLFGRVIQRLQGSACPGGVCQGGGCTIPQQYYGGQPRPQIQSPQRQQAAPVQQRQQAAPSQHRQQQVAPQPQAPSAYGQSTAPNLSNYVLRSELDRFVKTEDLKGFVTRTEMDQVIDARVASERAQFATMSDVSERFATKGHVDQQLANFATKGHVDQQLGIARNGFESRIQAVGSKLDLVRGAVETVADRPATGWLTAIGTVATQLGLEVAIPGGVFGMVGLKLLGAYLGHRRSRRGESSEQTSGTGGPASDPFSDKPFVMPPPGPAHTRGSSPRRRSDVSDGHDEDHETGPTWIEDPPPPKPETVVRTRQHLTRVPTVNLEAEAYAEALVREAKTFPTHLPIIERIRSTTEQLMAGKKTVGAGRGSSGERKPTLGWSDESTTNT